ncbi:hypothetical protein [Streptomyces sp. NPDC051569]|uniref:hypothetical protein n=1 Tax=Streptomyces sp. NPDC051569 TaxID=3365661 RepID=UPI00379CB578
MSKKRSQPPNSAGPGQFKGREQHGWSPDVDETAQQANPSAHRSFHPDQYAPEPDKGRTTSSAEDKKESLAGSPVESTSGRGEDRAGKSREGMHDTGRKGRSDRPSGSKDSSAYTGVDPQHPQDPKDPHSRRRGAR